MSPSDWAPADEVATDEWTAEVNMQLDGAIKDGFGDPNEAPLYNPAVRPVDAEPIFVPWQAFPGTIDKMVHLPPEERWVKAGNRSAQDEYCEWHSEFKNGELVRVTFTTEVPEYFEALHRADSKAVLDLYRNWIGEHVKPEELVDSEDNYDRNNPYRQSGEGLIHLQGGFNTLNAAIQLAAQAVVVREDENGNEIVDLADLVRCNGMGAPDRNSDPQIAATINGAAAGGARIALANPIGPFIEKLRMEQMEVDEPSLEVDDFWHEDRFMGENAVRASFAAPDGATPLSKVRLEGEPIRFGAQLAKRVNIQLGALVSRDRIDPIRGPCSGG